jgi:hypothetical protein
VSAALFSGEGSPFGKHGLHDVKPCADESLALLFQRVDGSTIYGSNYEFESDGESATNFLRSQVLPEPPAPVDPSTIAFGGGFDPWV